LAQRVLVEKAGLPPHLLNEIKHLATFQNPEFYKKQAMRLSTALTPRVISCAEDLPQQAALQRGCLDDLQELLASWDVTLEVHDARPDTLFLAMPVSWKGTLVQYAGRLHRRHHAKTEVHIIDYVDRNVPMPARMFEKRMRGYRAMGYARGEGSEAHHVDDHDYVVEYEDEAPESLGNDFV